MQSFFQDLVVFELLKQVLVHDQHSPALNASPHTAWAHATEPPRKAFRVVDHLQPGEHR